MSNCKGCKTPGDTHVKLSLEQSPTTGEEKEKMEQIPYRAAIGSLMYCSVVSRPDIAFSVSQVAQFASNPGEQHWTAVKRLFRYLQETKAEGLVLGGKEIKLMGYSDSDYAGHPSTFRSTSGYIFTLGLGAVTWGSRLQKVVTLSSTEAEYMALGESVKDAMWIRNLLQDLHYPQEEPTLILCDNQSAIKLVKNPEFHRKSKHISVKEHFVREKHEDGTVAVDYTPTETQAADMLTKQLCHPKLTSCKRMVNILPLALLTLTCLLSTSGAVFQTTSPLLWRKSSTPVISGLTGYHVQLSLEPGCNAFAKDNDTKLWCNTIFTRHVMTALSELCVGKVKTPSRHKRFDPLTLSLIAIGGAATIANSGFTFWNRVAIRQLESRMDASLNGILDALDQENNDVMRARQEMERMRDTMLQTKRVMLTASEYVSVTVNLETTLRVFLTKFYDGHVARASAALLNLTRYGISGPLVTPVSCDWDSDALLLNLKLTKQRSSDEQLVLDADPFTLYGRRDNEICKTEYVGAKQIVWDFRSKSSCPVKAIRKTDLILQSSNLLCANVTSDWKARGCQPKSAFSVGEIVQVKQTNDALYIYCYGYAIHVYRKREWCPEQVFVLPLTTNFSIAGQKYTFTSKKVTTESRIPLQDWMTAINMHLVREKDPYDFYSRHELQRQAIERERNRLRAGGSNWMHEWHVGWAAGAVLLMVVASLFICLCVCKKMPHQPPSAQVTWRRLPPSGRPLPDPPSEVEIQMMSSSQGAGGSVDSGAPYYSLLGDPRQ